MELYTDKSGISEITCFIRIHTCKSCCCSGSYSPACHCGHTGSIACQSLWPLGHLWL